MASIIMMEIYGWVEGVHITIIIIIIIIIIIKSTDLAVQNLTILLFFLFADFAEVSSGNVGCSSTLVRAFNVNNAVSLITV